MNQILDEKPYNKKTKKNLKLQFILSITFIISICLYIVSNNFKLSKQEKYSKDLINNYNITKLYSNKTTLESNIDSENSNILGIIEIPKINVYYPVFSYYDDTLLQTSPCRFFGPFPGHNGNLCIAGHNYDNDSFFSKINVLDINDEIILYSNYNKKYIYYVFDIYEVVSTDLSPIYSYNKNSKQITLITCNNLNNNRIIVKGLM